MAISTYILIGLAIMLAFLLGVLYGRTKKPKTDGSFIVDTLNPEKEVYSLELACALGEIPTKKYLILKVVTNMWQELPVA